MKLTAPPPTPPEPPTPGDPPGAEAPPGPDAAAPAELPPLPPPPPVATKPAKWPQWYSGADTLLVALAVALAFLVASFAARNSDLWVHLAAGRMLTTGDYTPGTDPFSYTAADRPWVNHAWLFDLGAYVLYRSDGFALVFAKALAVAVAVGLLIGIRRTPHALWPWAVVAAVAVVAAGPRLTLTPLTASFFFLSVTLFLIFRVPSPPGSWRLPISIGVTFWFWANCDAWFFVGPLSLLLLLVGEVVRTKAFNADGPALPPDDPLGPLPDATTLAKALGVGVLACMLNPHHVRVWDLPYELVGGPGTEDPYLRRLLLAPMTGEYWDNPALGYNGNGLALAVLLFGGLYAVALTGIVARLAGKPWDVEPLPLPHALLWFGIAALALKSIFAVPFLAAVSIPLLASRLNEYSARVELGSEDDTGTRMALALSTVGRVASVIVLVALGACAWPGWLHPQSSNPATARRVGWEVVPDPALARAAAQVGKWRADGRLGPDDRGFVAALDLSNYLAWYAPGERVFVNGRYNHHRAEWPAFVKARQGLGVTRAAEGVNFKDAVAVFDDAKVSYVSVSASAADTPLARLLTKVASHQLWANEARCAAWYLDGRSTLCGWRGAGAASFDRLRVDPVALAFGPDAEKLPPGQVVPVPPPRSWETDFTHPVRPAPPAAEEALAWLEYKEIMMASRFAPAFQAAVLMGRIAPLGFDPPLGANMFQMVMENQYAQGNSRSIQPADGSLRAAPVLALKAARKAIADNPDHPDGYSALARALGDPELPVNDSERAVGVVCALRQCLSRLPPPEEIEPGVTTTEGWSVARQLAAIYSGNPQRNGGVPGLPVDLPGLSDLAAQSVQTQGGQVVKVPYHYPIDLAHEAVILAGRYADREVQARPEDKEGRERREQILKGLKAQADRLGAARQQAIDNFRRVSELKPAKKDQFDAAVSLRLTGAAIQMVKDLSEGEAQAEFGADLGRRYLQVVGLELAVGRVEDAAADLEGLRESFDKLAAAQPPVPGAAVNKAYLRMVESQLLVVTGNYDGAGRMLEETEGRVALLPAAPPPADALPFGWPAATVVPSLNTTTELGRFYQQRVGMYLQVRQNVLTQSDQQAAFFFRRGYLALLEGDIEGARLRFAASRRPPIPAWEIPELVPPVAPVYLRMIDAAAAKK
ncbi:hypothetical protein [Urbifossiella limnaea]|uniref:Uncharacterized protein n=1 Tax=Urbifossiella limnaea TaxID=2528023 RepID=A0A517XYJ6_9BACT|nr:hypothetical protein [Urbifossiella limnaea]QDU22572.1 hypothetical protein ETAA1_45550 [Urbifossiella limnaea]